MFGFIDHINDEEELKDQIVRQTKLGWWGYFLKKMFHNGMTYYKSENVKEKKALQIITQQQSLFALVRNNYEDVCLTLLMKAYNGKMPDNHLKLRSGLKDVVSCMNLGNIYVTERDTDISIGDESLLVKLFKRNSRQFDIYIPPYISNGQMEELHKTMVNRENFAGWFKKEDKINLHHYIEQENIQYCSGNKALQYLVEELPHFVNDNMPINSDEQILVDMCKEATSTNPRQSVTFVERVDTEPVVANTDNSMQGNISETKNNEYTTPADTGTSR